MIFWQIQCLHLMYSEATWVLVSFGTRVQPQMVLDPVYLPDYLSVSYGYHKVENSRVNIFYKKNVFCKFTWENEVFPKLKLYEESPKIMFNKCAVPNCSTGYKTGQKKASFYFPENQESN